MASSPNSGTALAVARARFIDGLPQKSAELKASIALLYGTPGDIKATKETRRRLHGLYASAQVFRIKPMSEALKENIQLLDAVRDQERELNTEELDALAHLCTTLPLLGSQSKSVARISFVPGDSIPPSATVTHDGPRAEPPSHSTSLTGKESDELTVSNVLPPRPDDDDVTREAASFDGLLPGASIDTTITVLIVDERSNIAATRALLPNDRYETSVAHNADDGLRMARSASPDVVLLAVSIQKESGFIKRLHSDPLADFVPVVILDTPETRLAAVEVRNVGAAESITKPIGGVQQLGKVIGRVTGADGGTPFERIGEASVKEIAARLSEEIKHGLIDSVDQGIDVFVPMGEGSDVIAAAWAAIARVRMSISQRTNGRVHFRDTARFGPSLVNLSSEEEESPIDLHSVSLEGRRILIADDDPAVVWFFSGLLREVGAKVIETEDGFKALVEARRTRPDVVISDILMPGLDGLSLCRKMARDPGLGEVPIILLSWKEDMLERMRKLKAGAKGYLVKEAGAVQILTKVRSVLRPRAALEAQLGVGGQVQGRIEGVGVLTLLQTVKVVRGDALVTVRDSRNLFEIDVRDGELSGITLTATDGAFARGEKALSMLVGVVSGRFSVSEPTGTPKRKITTDLDGLLLSGTARLAGLIDAVSGKRMSKIHKVVMDKGALASFSETCPLSLQGTLRALATGSPPKLLISDGIVDGPVLDSLLLDLARQRVIQSVNDESGKDLIKEALAERARTRQVAAAARPSSPGFLKTPQKASTTRPKPPKSIKPLLSTPRKSPTAPVITAPVKRVSIPPKPAAPKPIIKPKSDSSSKSVTSAAATLKGTGNTKPKRKKGSGTQLGMGTLKLPSPDAKEKAPAANAPKSQKALNLNHTLKGAAPLELVIDETTPDPPSVVVDELPALLKQAKAGSDAKALLDAPTNKPPTPPKANDERVVATPISAAPIPNEDENGSGWSLVLVCIALVLASLLGARWWTQRNSTKSQDATVSTQAKSDSAKMPAPETVKEAPKVATPVADPTPEPAPDPTPDPGPVEKVEEPEKEGSARYAAGLSGLTVTEDQGVLSVQSDEEGWTVLSGKTRLGPAPLLKPLKAGRYELSFEKDDVVRYVSVFVRAGQTRVVRLPSR